MQKERSTGPRVARDERVGELLQELRGLAVRRDALEEQLLDVAHPQWEQRIANYNSLLVRIHNLHRRIGNLRDGEPELGHAVTTKDHTLYHKSRTQ